MVLSKRKAYRCRHLFIPSIQINLPANHLTARFSLRFDQVFHQMCVPINAYLMYEPSLFHSKVYFIHFLGFNALEMQDEVAKTAILEGERLGMRQIWG